MYLHIYAVDGFSADIVNLIVRGSPDGDMGAIYAPNDTGKSWKKLIQSEVAAQCH